MSILQTPFPHILAEDAEVWKRWLTRWGPLFDNIEYDVRVGTGRDPGAHHPANIRQMAIGLSKRRIDAVSIHHGQVYLFEITRLADLKCLGQVMAYPALYRQTFQPDIPIKMCVVAEKLGTDLTIPFRKANVAVYLV